MEIYKTKQYGRDVYCFYDGKYTFFNNFYGVLAQATRDEASRADCNGTQHFNVRYGNSSCLGGMLNEAAMQAAIKRTITKAENRYLNHKCTFEFEEHDFAHATLSVDVVER